MTNNVARMIGTLGIWISFAIIMACGLCRMNFNGEGVQPTFLLAVAMVCLAAVGSTAIVWKGSRGEPPVIGAVDERPAR
jgi:hypothetical protein